MSYYWIKLRRLIQSLRQILLSQCFTLFLQIHGIDWNWIHDICIYYSIIISIKLCTCYNLKYLLLLLFFLHIVCTFNSNLAFSKICNRNNAMLWSIHHIQKESALINRTLNWCFKPNMCKSCKICVSLYYTPKMSSLFHIYTANFYRFQWICRFFPLWNPKLCAENTFR